MYCHLRPRVPCTVLVCTDDASLPTYLSIVSWAKVFRHDIPYLMTRHAANTAQTGCDGSA